jgi:hypothetical protein
MPLTVGGAVTTWKIAAGNVPCERERSASAGLRVGQYPRISADHDKICILAR